MTRSRRTRHRHEAGDPPKVPSEYDRDVQGVAYFNDAVFAIAMTLLVVGLRVPLGTSTATLGQALRGLRSSLASYGISFLVIGFYWLGFHRQLHFLERFDGGALVINLVFLMSVAFLPFPTLLLNHYFGSVALIFYASCMAVTGVLLASLWIYANKRHLLGEIDKRLRSYYTLRALYAPVIFLLSIPVAVAAPRAAVYMWILVFLGRPILRRVAYR
jgi:uncharacterized membrane protein